jgi:hypothetical protein
MKDMLLLGIPDLPERAFVRAGRNIRPQGGGKGGSTPKQPDYVAAAQATSQGNLDLAKYATQANRVNQVTPWGSLTWSNDRAFDQDGYNRALQSYQQALQNSHRASDAPYANQWDSNGNVVYSNGGGAGGGGRSSANISAPNAADFYSGGDNWTQKISLSPEMQAMFDQQMKLQRGLFGSQDAAMGRVNQMMGSGFDTSGLPQGGDAFALQAYDPTRATNNATELLMQRMNPELDRQQEALRTQLTNQGIAQGSQAWNQAMGSFGQQRNDAASQAALAGIGLGMQQQGLTFSQELQQQQLANALRNSAFQEKAYLRNLPLAEFNALTNGSQVQMPQFPGYAQQATTGGPDILGATKAGYSTALDAANARNAQSQQNARGLGGLAGGGLGFMFGGPMGGLLGGGLGSAIGGLFG